MFSWYSCLLRMGSSTKIAEMLFDVQPLPTGCSFPLDLLSPEPPSQQAKQTVDGEQVDDGRVGAGKALASRQAQACQINIS
jgi:hypothetical protein